jgi:hypothetical protein
VSFVLIVEVVERFADMNRCHCGQSFCHACGEDWSSDYHECLVTQR